MVIFVWIVIFLCYAVVPNLTGPSQPREIHLEKGPASPEKRYPDSPSSSSFNSHQDSFDAEREKSPFGVRSLNRHGFEVRWDTETLWRHMAFSAWPAIANLYNFSLADRRLVVFEPIHVVQTFKAGDALRARPASSDADTPLRKEDSSR